MSKRTTTSRRPQRYAVVPFAIALGWLIGGLLQGDTLARAAVGAALPTAVAALLAAALWWASPRRRGDATLTSDGNGSARADDA